MRDMYISVLIIAVSLSLDAFGAGISYGIRKIRIPPVSKLIICLFSVLYSAASLLAGMAVSTVITPGAAKLSGAVILFGMGIWIIGQSLFKKEEKKPVEQGKNMHPQENGYMEEKALLNIAVKSLGITIQVIRNPDGGDIDSSGVIDKREAFLLGLALSVDAIGVGFGCALSGIGSMLIPAAAGIFQLLLLNAGVWTGRRIVRFRKVNRKAISVVPGLLLIAMALLKVR